MERDSGSFIGLEKAEETILRELCTKIFKILKKSPVLFGQNFERCDPSLD
jgi:hypothetical protein